MTDILVKYDGSWADEIELQGFLVMTDKEWKDYKKEVERLHESTDFTVSIGTNEDITFQSADDYFDSFEVKKLTDAESAVLRKLFKTSFSYENPKHRVKIDIAYCGVIPLYRPTDEEIDDSVEEEDEDS